MTRNEFHKLCEGESFLCNLQKEYPNTVRFIYFNPDSSLFIKEGYEHFNEALVISYANVAVMEDYGVENNSLLLAMNTFVLLYLMRLVKHRNLITTGCSGVASAKLDLR